MMPSPNITLRIPMSIKNRGFGLTSMESGLRAGGTVEIGGLQRRRLTSGGQCCWSATPKRIFPTLQTGEPVYWMGHRPSTPDSLPILGEAPGSAGTVPRLRSWSFRHDRRAYPARA